MAVTRPLKEGSVTTYQAKVAAGFPDILASEMDADLDTIYAAWNGGLPANSIGAAQIIDGSISTLELANGAVTTAKLAAGAASGNIVGTRQFNFAEYGRSSTAGFTVFLDSKTNAQPLQAGQMCRVSLGGVIAVAAGNLQLVVGTTTGSTVATPAGLGVVGAATYQLDAMVGAENATTYSVNVRWRLWTGVSTPSAPVVGAPLTDNFTANVGITVVAGGIRVAGSFSAANPGNAVQVTWALSEVL